MALVTIEVDDVLLGERGDVAPEVFLAQVVETELKQRKMQREVTSLTSDRALQRMYINNPSALARAQEARAAKP